MDKAPVYGQGVSHRQTSMPPSNDAFEVANRRVRVMMLLARFRFAALDRSSLTNGTLTVTPLSEHDSSRFDP